MDVVEVILELCDVANVNVSEISRDGYVEPVRACSWKVCREGRGRKEAGGTAGQVEDGYSAEIGRVLFGISFELFGVPVLGK